MTVIENETHALINMHENYIDYISVDTLYDGVLKVTITLSNDMLKTGIPLPTCITHHLHQHLRDFNDSLLKEDLSASTVRGGLAQAFASRMDYIEQSG